MYDLRLNSAFEESIVLQRHWNRWVTSFLRCLTRAPTYKICRVAKQGLLEDSSQQHTPVESGRSVLSRRRQAFREGFWASFFFEVYIMIDPLRVNKNNNSLRSDNSDWNGFTVYLVRVISRICNASEPECPPRLKKKTVAAARILYQVMSIICGRIYKHIVRCQVLGTT